jgi:hypothetical protein
MAGSLASPAVLPSGHKVDEPGVWDLSMEQYHSDIAIGPSVSSSGLRTIWAESPAHFWHTSSLNPNRAAQEDKPAFAVGRLAHKLLLEGREGLNDEFAVRPECWSDWRTKEAKVWRDEQVLAGKTVITEADLTDVVGMAESLARHPLVKAGILDGQVERSLFWKDAETGIWVKSRPDVIPRADRLAADLKTTPSVSTEALERSLAAFHYPMQAAVVRMAMREVLGQDMDEFAFVWVEKAPPYCVRVTVLPGADIERGEMQVRSALRTMARCLERGEWPGPGEDRESYLSLPTWAVTRIDRELEYAAAEAPANDHHHPGEAA